MAPGVCVLQLLFSFIFYNYYLFLGFDVFFNGFQFNRAIISMEHRREQNVSSQTASWQLKLVQKRVLVLLATAGDLYTVTTITV